jgi:hypothetical protein
MSWPEMSPFMPAGVRVTLRLVDRAEAIVAAIRMAP